MRWEVSGADGMTGRETTIELEAEDEKSVITKAKQQGLFVSGVKPIPATVQYVAPVERQESAEASATTASRQERKSLTWGEYVGIIALRVFASLFYLSGFSSLFFGNWEYELSRRAAMGPEVDALKLSHQFDVLASLLMILVAIGFHAVSYMLANRGTSRALAKRQ
jgi:hypothetical protein